MIKDIASSTIQDLSKRNKRRRGEFNYNEMMPYTEPTSDSINKITVTFLQELQY